MKDNIIGRKEEIIKLEKYLASGKSEFVAIYGRRVGVILPDDQMDGIRSAWNFTYEDMAVVLYNGNLRIVNPENLLVNLPEVLNNNIYNIVYSYAATSRCAGKPRPVCHDNDLPRALRLELDGRAARSGGVRSRREDGPAHTRAAGRAHPGRFRSRRG